MVSQIWGGVICFLSSSNTTRLLNLYRSCIIRAWKLLVIDIGQNLFGSANQKPGFQSFHLQHIAAQLLVSPVNSNALLLLFLPKCTKSILDSGLLTSGSKDCLGRTAHKTAQTLMVLNEDTSDSEETFH